MILTSARRLEDHVEFVSLSDCKEEKFPLVEKIFNELMTLQCGPQPQVIADIKERRERKTEILTLKDERRDVGCIVYKRNLITEKAQIRMENCLEVTLFALFNEALDKAVGYRSILLKRIEEVAKSARASFITLRLPEKLDDYIAFFKRHGFTCQEVSILGRGAKECLLFKSIVRANSMERGAKQKEKPEIQKRKAEDDPSLTLPDGYKKEKKSVSEQKGAGSVLKTPIHLADGSHQLTLKKPFIAPIRQGIKTIEGRINSGAPAKFKVGDNLRFFYPQDERDDVTCIISKIERFKGFKEMLEATGFQKCIPGAQTLEQALRVYEDIPGFMDRAKQHGVIAIHLAKK